MRFKNKKDLHTFLENLGDLYPQYCDRLWDLGPIRSTEELAVAPEAELRRCGVQSGIHIARIKTTANGVASGSGQAGVGAGAGAAAACREVPGVTAFVQALTQAELQPVGNGMSMLSCGPGVRFPDAVSGTPATMLVRDFYPSLMERLSEGRAWLLTGLPGTGKSWFVWSAVHHLLRQPQPPAIVWQAVQKRGLCMLLKDGKAFEGDVLAFTKELEDSTTWYICDGMLPMGGTSAHTIMICSPQRKVYKNWLKMRGVVHLTMPLWTWEEIKECYTQLYKGIKGFTLDRVKINFMLWYGGVPSLVLQEPSLSKDPSSDSRDALGAIRTTNINQVIAACSGAYDACVGANHRVIHQDGDRNTFVTTTYRFATSHVASLFLREVSQRGDLARLVQALSASPGNDEALRDLLFEACAHATLLQGGRFEFRYLDRPGGAHAAAVTSTLQLADSKAQVFFTPGSRSQTHTNIDGFRDAARQLQQSGAQSAYLRPSAQGHPAVDSCIFPNCLRQMTVAETRGRVDEELLEAHLKCLPTRRRYFLDYVVPQDVYHTFKTPKLQRRGRTPRVQKTHVRVIKIVDITSPAAFATSLPPGSATPSPSAAAPSLPPLGATPAAAAAAARQRKRKRKGGSRAEEQQQSEQKGEEEAQEEQRGRTARRGSGVDTGAAAAEKKKKKKKKKKGASKEAGEEGAAGAVEQDEASTVRLPPLQRPMVIVKGSKRQRLGA